MKFSPYLWNEKKSGYSVYFLGYSQLHLGPQVHLPVLKQLQVGEIHPLELHPQPAMFNVKLGSI
jgi:hypothetical protein